MPRSFRVGAQKRSRHTDRRFRFSLAEARLSKPHSFLSNVLLDDLGRPQVRVLRVAPRFAQGTTLAQQVPALVELDVDRREPLARRFVERSLVEQSVVLRDKLLDVGGQ